MKKIISILVIAALVLSMCAFLVSCGDETPDVKDTEAAPEKTVAGDDTAADTEADTEADSETEAAGPITEGKIDIPAKDTGDVLVSVELKDGWYSEEGLDELWNEVELVNDDITDFLANVSVKVGNVYGDDHAKEWADNIQGNYGGKGEITEEEIAGHTFYHLSGVTDDDTQNIYFADLDEKHYVEVDIMFMDVEKGLPVFDLLTFAD